MLVITLLFFTFCSFAFSFEFTAENSFFLNCPINSTEDYERIQNLSKSGSHPIDIFEEKLSLDSTSTLTIIQLLTDEATSEILLSRFGCFEEKGRAALRNLFTPPDNYIHKIGNEFHDDYRTYQNIIDQLFHYSKQYPSHIKSLKSIGKTVEGRDLFVIHISDPSNQPGTKPLVWIMAGQHAREWIAVSSAMIFVDEILKFHDQSILKNYEFAVMPLVNPDGYEYSRTVNRMWRKNRKWTGKTTVGIDLNRNWDHRWCEIGKNKLGKKGSCNYKNVLT